MYDKLPIEIIFHIKSFMSIWEFFMTKKKILQIEHDISHMIQKPYDYYNRINLKNIFYLRWKRLYPNTNRFYYRNLKHNFKYFITIQDDLYFYTITIYPQWTDQFSEMECNIIDEYFYSFNMDMMTNVNTSFAEMIFYNDISQYNIYRSPLMLFMKLDEMVYIFQNDLEYRLFNKKKPSIK